MPRDGGRVRVGAIDGMSLPVGEVAAPIHG